MMQDTQHANCGKATAKDAVSIIGSSALELFVMENADFQNAQAQEIERFNHHACKDLFFQADTKY